MTLKRFSGRALLLVSCLQAVNCCYCWVIKSVKEVRKLIDMSEIYETMKTSTLRKVTYEDDEISIVAYKVGKIIRIDVKETK